jgi:hypothetical protein
VRLGDLLGVGEDEGHRLLRPVRAVAVLVLRALALLVLEELVRVAKLLEQLDRFLGGSSHRLVLISPTLV